MPVRDMLTEDEAKKKICPVIRDQANEFNMLCMTSSCMFWRWSHQDSNGIPTGFCGGASLPKYI